MSRLALKLTAKVWASCMPKGVSKVVLLCFCPHVDDNGNCVLSISSLMHFCNLSERSVVSHISALKKAGLVSAITIQGVKSIYCIDLSSLVEIPAPIPKKKKKKTCQELRLQVFERDAYRCKHCGTQENLRVDHIHPESKGGLATMDNLQTLCTTCNSKKGVAA